MQKKRRRYTEKQRARILAATKRDGLTSRQAAKKFGVSEVSLWKWRKAAKSGARERGRRAQVDGPLAMMIRAEIRARVRELLPVIVREEIVRDLGSRSRRN